MTEKTGTFVVTHAADESAVLQDASDSQIHTLESNPGLVEGEVVDATLEAVPPMEATWEVADLVEQRSIAVERSAESPTKQAREAGADQEEGDLTHIERAGTGELHVITVPADATEQAVADVLDDETGLVSRAARLEVERVEVRAADGVVSVRYLP